MEANNTRNSKDTNPVTSEIALFLQQWDAEVEAARLALKGYALTARHEFITKRMQSFGNEKMIEMITLEAQKMNLQAREAQNNPTSLDTTKQ